MNEKQVALSDKDDGSSEAQIRIQDMRDNPDSCLSWDEVKEAIGR